MYILFFMKIVYILFSVCFLKYTCMGSRAFSNTSGGYSSEKHLLMRTSTHSSIDSRKPTNTDSFELRIKFVDHTARPHQAADRNMNNNANVMGIFSGDPDEVNVLCYLSGERVMELLSDPLCVDVEQQCIPHNPSPPCNGFPLNLTRHVVLNLRSMYHVVNGPPPLPNPLSCNGCVLHRKIRPVAP